ncbi:MAG: peptidoglycan-binding protein LysM [Rhodobacteraceae bacterium]|nr:MAG: peptidoglycan-binding protein LysM [Paracoccaceae bacterium]
MGVFSFLKSAGKAVFGGKAAAEEPEKLKEEIAGVGVDAGGLDIVVVGDTVKLTGKAATQEAREKAILAVGNIEGVATVEEAIVVEASEPESVFHTVERGDTLSAIARKHYGDANAYTKIFEANKPMLSHPDKIYPGQVLRIPG